jgi:hypothetical protein
MEKIQRGSCWGEATEEGSIQRGEPSTRSLERIFQE